MLNLNDNLKIEEIMELTDGEVGHFCDDLLDANTLLEEIENEPGGRKAFCEYLGIGESTLTGWLKEDRIPRMAKEAYALRRMVSILKLEIKKIKGDLKIIKSRNGYQVCKFEEDEDGVTTGYTLLEGIENIKIARFFGSSLLSLQLLQEAKDFINDEIDVRDGFSPTEHLENLRDRITATTLFSTKYDDWRSIYGKRRFEGIEVDLDGLILKNKKTNDAVPAKSKTHGKYQLILKSNVYGINSYGEAIVLLLQTLHGQDKQFLSKLSNERTARNAKIITTKDDLNDLYPISKGGHSLKNREVHIANGWYTTTCVNDSQAIGRIKIICQVAGLTYPDDVSVSFVSGKIKLTLEDLGL